jgi:hypothetical protein
MKRGRGRRGQKGYDRAGIYGKKAEFSLFFRETKALRTAAPYIGVEKLARQKCLVRKKGLPMCKKYSVPQRKEKARRAKDTAACLFPDEKWIKIEQGIFLSSRRSIGKKTNYAEELRDAQILRDTGSTVYLAPESRHKRGKQFDAIVDGLIFEFKSVGGNTNTLEHQFLRSRSQAPNVFINLETSNLTKKQIMSALYKARNKDETRASHGFDYYNKFNGGTIILKIKDQSILEYLKVDDLKI